MLRLVALGLLVILGAGSVSAADLTLANAGRTGYAIVIDPAFVGAGKDAAGNPVVTPVQHAAVELATFLKQVTGAEFPITPSAAPLAQPMLVVGPGAVQRTLAADLKLDQLKPDGIVIETRGQNLLFAGDEPRGTLYAVYTFLEDTVGCRWWSSKASTIPNRPTLTVPEQHVRYVPPLEYREPFWYDAFDKDFAVRNKYNGMRANVDAERGGKISYGSMFVHTFNGLVPPAMFAEHPEWFSERDGKRIGGKDVRSQLCLTNPELTQYVIGQVLDRLAKNPEMKIVSVSQNDWDAHCLCANCKKLEDEEGSPCGPLLHFVNKVAAAVAEKYPNVAVDTLAYQYTRKPPLHVKPLPNVIVRLCSIECDFATPLTSETNATFASDIKGWSQICKRLYIWDYTTDFAHYILPFPNLRVLDHNVRFFVDNGVKGLFEQGNYQSPGGDMAEVRAWVLAKLLWNPRLDGRKLAEEFIAGYYGPAAPYMSEYIKLLHDSVEQKKTYLTIWVTPTTPYLTFDLMSKAEALFNKAEAAVQDNPDLLGRVQLSRLPIRYVWTMRWPDFQAAARKAGVPWPGPADYLKNAQTFMAIAQANNVTKISEGSGLEAFASRSVDLGRGESPVPEGCEKLPEEQWVDLQDSGFSLAGEGRWVKLAHDDAASDKVAARLGGETNEWAVQQRLGSVELDPAATYTIYVRVRCEKTGEEGLGFSSGLYDAKNKKFLCQVRRDCKEITEPGYVTYKIGSSTLHDQMYLWAAGPKNPQNVKAVWVDRFWLVKEK